MKSNKNTKYFIGKADFKEINKNPFIAGLLSIFLGILGVHRFYLKRKLTGLIFIAVSILSTEFGQSFIAVFLFLFTFIEGISYLFKGISMLLENKSSNNTDEEKIVKVVDKSVNGKKEKMSEERITIDIKEKNNVNEVYIIEISDIEPSVIPRNKNAQKHISKINWEKRLELPYERSIMNIEQVREETINFYVKLCNYIDELLKNNNSSLTEMIKKLNSNPGYYTNTLYTIYCISEGHVTKRYSGGYNYYNPEYSYKILRSHLGGEIRGKVNVKAKELEKSIPPPNEETIKHYNLTDSGLPRKWWDSSGELRENIEFSQKELNILEATPQRSTMVWDINEVKKQIIFLYFDIWEIISNGLPKKIEWRNKKIFQNVIKGKYQGYSFYETRGILMTLIKIAENTVREIMPSTQVLNMNDEQAIIKSSLPKEITQEIENHLTKYKREIDNEMLLKIITGMEKNKPNDWRLKFEKILVSSFESRINLLIEYAEDDDFLKIARKLVRLKEDENLTLLSLYAIERERKLNQTEKKQLESIIHPNNISIYEDIIKSKESLSHDLSNRLIELKDPIRREINLDMNKVEVSKNELNRTVDILKEYIGDVEEDIEPIQEENSKDETIKVENYGQSRLKYSNFINSILSEGSLCIEEGKKIAMDNGTLLNAFISDANRELYEYIQDQAIVIEDEYIKIDDFYVDMVKELVVSE